MHDKDSLDRGWIEIKLLPLAQAGSGGTHGGVETLNRARRRASVFFNFLRHIAETSSYLYVPAILNTLHVKDCSDLL